MVYIHIRFRLWHRIIGAIDSLFLVMIALGGILDGLNKEWVPESGATPPGMDIVVGLITLLLGLVGLFIFITQEETDFFISDYSLLRFKIGSVIIALLAAIAMILGFQISVMTDRLEILIIIMFVCLQFMYLGIKGILLFLNGEL